MELDYASFMAGVLTGLKLGREPKSRVPPAPSDNYMITEIDEDRMITESGNPMVTE